MQPVLDSPKLSKSFCLIHFFNDISTPYKLKFDSFDCNCITILHTVNYIFNIQSDL